jgi:hypothetical protein
VYSVAADINHCAVRTVTAKRSVRHGNHPIRLLYYDLTCHFVETASVCVRRRNYSAQTPAKVELVNLATRKCCMSSVDREDLYPAGMPDRQTLLGHLWDRQLTASGLWSNDDPPETGQLSLPGLPAVGRAPSGVGLAAEFTEVRGENPPAPSPPRPPAPSPPSPPSPPAPITKERGEAAALNQLTGASDATRVRGESPPPPPPPAPPPPSKEPERFTNNRGEVSPAAQVPRSYPASSRFPYT